MFLVLKKEVTLRAIENENIEPIELKGIITKIGRKYFTVKIERFYREIQFQKQNGEQHIKGYGKRYFKVCMKNVE